MLKLDGGHTLGVWLDLDRSSRSRHAKVVGMSGTHYRVVVNGEFEAGGPLAGG